MKNKYIGLTLCLLLIFSSCKKTEVEFSYTPSSPMAGETVTFTNLTENGDEYNWTFGDNAESTISSPNHTYKKAGTYIVTLTETKKNKSCSHVITVKDSHPYVYTNADSVRYYTPVTFKAYIYNPFSYKLTYQWQVDSTAVILSSNTTSETISVYFRKKGMTTVNLIVKGLPNDTIDIQQNFTVHHCPEVSLLYRKDAGDFFQRIYSSSPEPIQVCAIAAQKQLLDSAQDTIANYGSKRLTLHNLGIAGHNSIQGFQIDAQSQKIYFRDKGLYVCHINGQNVVCIDSEPTIALCVDVLGDRIYWSTGKEVKYLPLIHQSNNQHNNTISILNSLDGVTKIAKDNTKR